MQNVADTQLTEDLCKSSRVSGLQQIFCIKYDSFHARKEKCHYFPEHLCSWQGDKAPDTAIRKVLNHCMHIETNGKENL